MIKILIQSSLIAVAFFVGYGFVIPQVKSLPFEQAPPIIPDAGDLDSGMISPVAQISAPEEASFQGPTILSEVSRALELPVAYGETKIIDNNPSGLSIPAIGLNSPIEFVGINHKGEMDVPSGDTNNAGWYKYGTLPGNKGSAVLAAHVYAAFGNLHKLKVGDSIFIETRDGTKLRFVVEETVTYNLSDVPRQRLFNRDDAPRLNLITCAGAWSRDINTYTQRLIVYAKLVR
jgi:LPXTG-site transpeptidase (sortase) family protein